MSKITEINIKRKVGCEICGNESFYIVYKKRGKPKRQYFITDDSYGIHAQIVKCLHCGLMFAYPREDDSKIQQRYFSFIDPEYEDERDARSDNQRTLVQTCQKLYGKRGTLLDIGCATGVLLEAAKKEGWRAIGIEPSQWATKVARDKYGLNVVNGVFNENSFQASSFDIATCVDVVEHVTNPKMLLESIHKVLRPKGVLCIVTPDKRSLVARLLGEKWWHIRPDHIYYFSKKDFSVLLQLAGFKIEKMQRYAWCFSFDYWASRFQNKIPIVYQLLMFMKKVPIMKVLTRRSYSINFCDSMEIYCRKA